MIRSTKVKNLNFKFFIQTYYMNGIGEGIYLKPKQFKEQTNKKKTLF